MRLLGLLLPLVLFSFACDKGPEKPADPAPATPSAEPQKQGAKDIEELATRQLKDKGVVKTECPPMITTETAEFDCVANGETAEGPKKVTVHAKRVAKGRYEFTMDTQIFDAAKIAGAMPEGLGGAVKDVTCGKGVFYAKVGETFRCSGVNVATGKDVWATATVLPKDEIQYKMIFKNP